MKDKDPNEDEFNQDEQDNINEADDSFGLPDLDFNTLDEEESAQESEPKASEEEQEPEATEEQVEEETIEQELTDEVVEESVEEEIEEEIEEEFIEEPIQRTYVPPKEESNAPRIIVALVVTILLSGAIWYFMFYRPRVQAEEKAKIEALAKQQEADRIAAAKKKEEADRLAAEQAANKEADADEAASNIATFTTISAPSGRYYIVIKSFIDDDMAKDYGNKMKADGFSTVLLAPKAGAKKFNRVTMGDFGSFVEAQEAANKLKGEFGDDLWVLKY